MAKFVGFRLPGLLGPITGIVPVITGIFLILGRFWQGIDLVLLFIPYNCQSL